VAVADPDPTILTTEQLMREIERVKELMMAKFEGQNQVFAERFSSVGTRFELVEQQRKEQKEDTATAVQAALNAAKEAVKEQTTASEKSITKSETATSEQLKQLSTTFTTAQAASDGRIDDIKTRIERMENLKQGGKEAFSTAQAAIALLLGLLAIAAILAGAGVFTR
jgi:cobalamin biosynthesis Mg chelatase CobN